MPHGAQFVAFDVWRGGTIAPSMSSRYELQALRVLVLDSGVSAGSPLVAALHHQMQAFGSCPFFWLQMPFLGGFTRAQFRPRSAIDPDISTNRLANHFTNDCISCSNLIIITY